MPSKNAPYFLTNYSSFQLFLLRQYKTIKMIGRMGTLKQKAYERMLLVVGPYNMS